jgi:hypothetical protein
MRRNCFNAEPLFLPVAKLTTHRLIRERTLLPRLLEIRENVVANSAAFWQDFDRLSQ